MEKTDVILRFKWLLAIICLDDYYKNPSDIIDRPRDVDNFERMRKLCHDHCFPKIIAFIFWASIFLVPFTAVYITDNCREKTQHRVISKSNNNVVEQNEKYNDDRDKYYRVW